MANQDYYTLLGIERDAGEAEIKSAYRRLARQYHPDSADYTPNTALEFHEVDEAYEVLRDPIERAKYDATLAAKSATPKPPSSQAWRYEHRPTPSGFQQPPQRDKDEMWEVFTYVFVMACCVMACGLILWLTGVVDHGAVTHGWSKTSADVDRVVETSCGDSLGTCFNVFYHYSAGESTYQDYLEKTRSIYAVGDTFSIEYKDENPERNVVAKQRSEPTKSGELVAVFLVMAVMLGLSWGVLQLSSKPEQKRASQ
jgi:curved DNA-binding protein CbpA